MGTFTTKKMLVRMFVGESKKWHHRPLWEALLERLHRDRFAGVTVTRGVAGFGAKGAVHTAHLLELSADLPMILEIVEDAGRRDALLAIVEEMAPKVLVTIEEVEVVRVETDG